MPLTQTQLDILALIRRSKEILILPSSPIDGDCLGSSLALYLALKKLGKNVTVVAEERIPKSYNFLPAIQQISQQLEFSQDFVITIDCRDHRIKDVRHEIQGNKINIFVTPESGMIDEEHVTFGKSAFPYDCIITVDAADPSQFGSIYENFTELLHVAPLINIDHHASNSSFGRINYVDIMAPSTTTLILPLLENLDAALIDGDIATLLLAGLITDTGSFQNPNTTPDAFAIAAKLIALGARQQEIIRHIYKTKQLSQLRLWGRTLTKIQHDERYKIVWSVLTKRDFEEIGGTPDQTEGVIDELMSNAPNADVIFLLKEKDGVVKGSIRTTASSIDASELAKLFGGGGHTQAAGFGIIGMPIEQAEQKVLAAFRASQSQRLHLGDEAETIPAPQPPPSPMPTRELPRENNEFSIAARPKAERDAPSEGGPQLGPTERGASLQKNRPKAERDASLQNDDEVEDDELPEITPGGAPAPAGNQQPGPSSSKRRRRRHRRNAEQFPPAAPHTPSSAPMKAPQQYGWQNPHSMKTSVNLSTNPTNPSVTPPGSPQALPPSTTPAPTPPSPLPPPSSTTVPSTTPWTSPPPPVSPAQ